MCDCGNRKIQPRAMSGVEISRYLFTPKCSIRSSNFGHQTGAQLLRTVQRAWQSRVTSMDITSLSSYLGKFGSVMKPQRNFVISKARWSADILYLQSYRCSTEGGSRCDAAGFPGFAHVVPRCCSNVLFLNLCFRSGASINPAVCAVRFNWIDDARRFFA